MSEVDKIVFTNLIFAIILYVSKAIRTGRNMDYSIKDNNGDLSFIETEKKVLKEQLLKEYISLRKAKNLSQEDIAFLTGIARPNISRIENGKYDPTLEVLTKLAAALDMKLEIRFVEKEI